MGSIEGKLKEHFWGIMKACLREDEPVHGVPHIERVYKNFELLIENNSLIPEEISKSLECAVILHDIGFREGKDCHALRSIQILKEEYPVTYSEDLQKKEWVEYAIKYHSVGKKDDPKKSEKICLDLLMILDHMDALGESGIIRDFIDINFSAPLIPEDKNYSEEDVEKCLFCHDRKNNSILERLFSNYCYTKINLQRVKSCLSEKFIDEYKRKAELTKNFCLNLIKLK